MMSTRSDVEFIVNKILAGFKVTRVDEIPAIDLYMDQVLTFLGERLRRTARKSDADKIRQGPHPPSDGHLLHEELSLHR